MSNPYPEDPIQFLERVLKHAKTHMELAEKSLQSREFETLDFTLSVIAQDVLTLRRYINDLAQRGVIRKLLAEK